MTEEYENNDEEPEEQMTSGGLPEGVLERLAQLANRTKQELTDIKEQFLKQIATEYECTNAADEDEDYSLTGLNRCSLILVMLAVVARLWLGQKPLLDALLD